MQFTDAWTRPAGALLAVLLVAGCGGGSTEAPAPGANTTVPPDLRGRVVMVLPVQAEAGVLGDVDAELRFALEARGEGIDWVFRDRLDSALERAPALQTRTTGLPVSMFMSREVQRVGDPLYGEIRRLASLVDAEVALIPVQVLPGAADEAGHWPLQVAVALLLVRSGHVLWFGVEEGSPGEPGSPGVLASAMESLARRLLWYTGG